MIICNKNHRYADALSQLPLDQGGEGRHLCAGCAYEQGMTDGLNNTRRSFEELNLPFSQAGTGRHKSPQAAYDKGFEKGSSDYKG